MVAVNDFDAMDIRRISQRNSSGPGSVAVYWTITRHNGNVTSLCRQFALKEVPLDERSKHRTKDSVVSEAKYVLFLTYLCMKTI